MAADGSLIFNTKIDESGLNSDLARINKAIREAENKAQAGAKQTADNAERQTEKTAQAVEKGAKRQTAANKETAAQAQTSAKKTAQTVEQSSKQAENAVKDTAADTARTVEQSAENTASSVTASADKATDSISGSTDSISSDTADMADSVMDSSDFITMAVKAVIGALKKLEDTVGQIGKTVAFTAQKVAEGIGSIFAAAGKFTLKQFIGDYENQSSGLSKLLIAAGSYFSLYKLFDWSREGVQLGSDLSEVQNVVDVTFSSMSAKVDDWAKSAQNAYGLSEAMAKRYVGTFGSMAEAFGFTEQQAYDMSTALTGLTGDVASFYNITQDEAYTKLKSVFSGETETLKDLGVVMTQNALDNYAMANGYGNTTAKMTEAEKVTLRYNFVLDQLNNAMGDFVRTQSSWANQTRVLQLRWDTLLATVGKALINIFTPVLQVLNAVLDRLQSIAQWFESVVTAVFGNYSASSGALSDGMNDLSDSAQNAADSVTDTSTAVEDLQNNLSAFDELNVMSDTSQEVDTDIAAQVNRALMTSGIISDIVDEAVKPLTDFKVDKLLVKSIKDGNWRMVGLVLAQRLKKALKKIPWGAIKNSAVEIATNIADFINGALEDPTLWETIGLTIAEGLNTAIKFLLTLLTKIDWEKLGNAIAEMLNGFLENFNEEQFGQLLAERINAVFDTIAGFAEKFDWKLLGSKLAGSLFSYFKSLNLTEEGEGSSIPETIANIINGVVQAGIELFTYTDPETGENIWAYIGKILGDGLNEFLTSFSVKDAIEFVKDGINAIVTLIYNAFAEISKNGGFVKLGEDLAEGVNDWFGDTQWWASLGKMINEIINDLLDMLIGFIDGLDVGAIDKALTSFFSEIHWNDIFGKVSYAAGTALAKAVVLFLDKIPVIGDILKYHFKNFLIVTAGVDYADNVFGSIDEENTGEELGKEIGSNIASGMSDGFVKASSEKRLRLSANVEETTGQLIGAAKDTIQNDTTVAAALTEKGTEGQTAVTAAFDKNKTVRHFEDVWHRIQSVFSYVGDFFRNTFSDAWAAVKNIFSDQSGIKRIKNSVETVFKLCLNNLISGFNSALFSPIDALNRAIIKFKEFKIANQTPFSWMSTLTYTPIPKLATGAYVPANYGEFLAVLGDNKREPEVVSPISAMKQAMAEVLTEAKGFGKGDIHITLTMPDGRVLFDAVVDENNREKKRTGRSALA